MFEFLFKYPLSAFSRGRFVLLGAWPRSVLLLSICLAAAVLAWAMWRKRSNLRRSFFGVRAFVLWGLQSALLALLLFVLWQPALSVTALKPQENVIAVLVDDSRSMALKDGSESREEQAKRILDSQLLKDLRGRFQVRLYRLGAGVERITDSKQLTASQTSTQIGRGLRQIAEEAGTLPIGSVLLLSDGADNTGGVDLATLSEIRRRRLPINTVGFGREQLLQDIEVDGLDLPAKTLEGSRLEAQITLRQNGFSGKHGRITLTSSGSVLASRDVAFKDTAEQVQTVEFNAGRAGVKNVEVRVDPLPGETNTQNNRQTRVLSVDNTKHRILYVEGEPRWDYKFIRRALEDDPAIQIASMLRTTQNKIYRQGLANPKELVEGFPSKPEELFKYEGLVIGSLESAFFTVSQQEAIKNFVDRRGGGLLFLGGRSSLADGGYNVSPFNELLPVTLPTRRNTFQRTFVAAELTDAGKKSLLCRIEDDPQKSINHWEILPYLANYQDPGTPKPGATVLARVNAAGNRTPLLVTENYGRGRTGVFASGGSWRWRMQQPLGDNSQETFWRQLLRWTAGATPPPVVLSTQNATLKDDGRMQLRAEVRDPSYQLASDAEVSVHIVEPDGSAENLLLRPEPLSQGVYTAEWNAPKTGSYMAEVTARRGAELLGKDTMPFRREDGLAENYHREQNRELLKQLAEQTGGQYYQPNEAKRMAGEIAYSEAGITSRELRDLWNMPAIFLAIVLLKSTEWLLRRRWGVV